jgi:hypothetical protein
MNSNINLQDPLSQKSKIENCVLQYQDKKIYEYFNRYTKDDRVLLRGNPVTINHRRPATYAGRIELCEPTFSNHNDEQSIISELINGAQIQADPLSSFFSDINGWDETQIDFINSKSKILPFHNYLSSYEGIRSSRDEKKVVKSLRITNNGPKSTSNQNCIEMNITSAEECKYPLAESRPKIINQTPTPEVINQALNCQNIQLNSNICHKVTSKFDTQNKDPKLTMADICIGKSILDNTTKKRAKIDDLKKDNEVPVLPSVEYEVTRKIIFSKKDLKEDAKEQTKNRVSKPSIAIKKLESLDYKIPVVGKPLRIPQPNSRAKTAKSDFSGEKSKQFDSLISRAKTAELTNRPRKPIFPLISQYNSKDSNCEFKSINCTILKGQKFCPPSSAKNSNRSANPSSITNSSIAPTGLQMNLRRGPKMLSAKGFRNIYIEQEKNLKVEDINFLSISNTRKGKSQNSGAEFFGLSGEKALNPAQEMDRMNSPRSFRNQIRSVRNRI